MSQDEEEVQKKRAQRLREQLTRLKSGKPKVESGSESAGSTQESPHDFVQRRMREKAREQQSSQPSDDKA